MARTEREQGGGREKIKSQSSQSLKVHKVHKVESGWWAGAGTQTQGREIVEDDPGWGKSQGNLRKYTMLERIALIRGVLLVPFSSLLSALAPSWPSSLRYIGCPMWLPQPSARRPHIMSVSIVRRRSEANSLSLVPRSRETVMRRGPVERRHGMQ